MNIAIEYMLRGQKIRNFLQLPCSLFLENYSDKTKLIIVLSEGYGRDWVIVRRYSPWKTRKHDMLPPSKEIVIKLSEVFEHSDVVIAGHKLLEFKEEPYETPEKHHAEMPHAAIQERDYRESLERFFNPKSVRNDRENWLWECFEGIYVPEDVKARYGISIPSMQREYVSHYCKSTWKIWEYWKKHLLEFLGPASELVFAKAYKSQFLEVKPEPDITKRHIREIMGEFNYDYNTFPGTRRKKRKQPQFDEYE